MPWNEMEQTTTVGDSTCRRTADTEIFSLLLVAGLSVAIGYQLNESKSLAPVDYRAIFRSKHITTNSSGKVMTKWHASSDEIGEAHA
jgi:hypothetical protein